MCKAKELSKELLELIDKIQNEKSNLCKELSQYDLATDSILHKIELGNFNACEGYKLCKELQQIRKNRRRIKYELDPMNSICSNTGIIGLKTKVKHSISNIERLENRELYKDIIESI